MDEIKNVEGLSGDDINRELSNGGKFVVFQYSFSIIVMTFKRSSSIYLIKTGESTFRHSLGHNIVTLLFGWWGIPWGPIYSIGSLYTNLSGGKDITEEVLTALKAGNGE